MFGSPRELKTMMYGGIVVLLIVGGLLGVAIWEGGQWVARHVNVEWQK